MKDNTTGKVITSRGMGEIDTKIYKDKYEVRLTEFPKVAMRIWRAVTEAGNE